MGKRFGGCGRGQSEHGRGCIDNMGGTGGGITYNVEELRVIAARGLAASLVHQILIEEAVIGWEELVDAGGYSGARDRGTLRTEGRDYVMNDGDVMTVNFTP